MKLSEFADKASNQNNNQNEKLTDAKKAYDELKDLSHDELMNRLAKEIQHQKKEGSFNIEALKESIERIKAYLPAQTYENMLRIIEKFNEK